MRATLGIDNDLALLRNCSFAAAVRLGRTRAGTGGRLRCAPHPVCLPERARGAPMTTPERLPLLPLDDTVVLPGMAVPVELGDAEARVAVDAAGTDAGPARVLLTPRLSGRYAGVGTVAVVEQVGRLPGGQPGAVV